MHYISIYLLFLEPYNKGNHWKCLLNHPAITFVLKFQSPLTLFFSDPSPKICCGALYPYGLLIYHESLRLQWLIKKKTKLFFLHLMFSKYFIFKLINADSLLNFFIHIKLLKLLKLFIPPYIASITIQNYDYSVSSKEFTYFTIRGESIN